MRTSKRTQAATIALSWLFLSACAPATADGVVDAGGARVRVPTGLELWRNLPDFESHEEGNTYLDGRIILQVNYDDQAALAETRPNMLSGAVREAMSDGSVDFEMLSSLLGRQPFVLSRYNPMGDLSESYSVFERDNVSVGETHFVAGADGLLAPGGYSFQGRFLVNAGILRLNLIYYDLEYDIPASFPEFFEERGSDFYWKSRASRLELYEAVVDEKSGAPPALIELHKSWEELLSNLELPGVR